jgi:succinate-acetate transporter protein
MQENNEASFMQENNEASFCFNYLLFWIEFALIMQVPTMKMYEQRR